jgi:hypothetical protein
MDGAYAAEFEPTTAERIARTGAVFRAANERIRQATVDTDLKVELLPVICECADPACREILKIPVGAYDHVRRNPRWFFNAPGHEGSAPAECRVVAEAAGYLTVETTGVAGEIAGEVAARGSPPAA